MKGNRIYTGAAGKISDHWFFLRKTLRVTRLEVPAIYSSISRHEQKTHRSCAEDGLVLAEIGRCALVDRLGVGGGRSEMGQGPLHL